MAATYGYGAEFSSDEDIDHHQSDTIQTNKFSASNQAAKPTKQQLEDIIQTIRQIPADQEITLGDEYLVGLLDYYKISRGPVVDSTRNLYRRLVIKQVRDVNNSPMVASNGDAINNNNNNLNGNSDNNNSINIISKRLQTVGQVEPASSDDDEPMPPVSSQSSVEGNQARRKFDSRVAYTTTTDKPEPMEVDAVAVAPATTPALLSTEIRTTKQVDISSSEDSDNDEESSGSSDSEELDITPLKSAPQLQQHHQQQQQLIGKPSARIIASTPIKDSATKTSTPVTPKDSSLTAKSSKSTTKAPKYTRSQRVATRSSSGVSKPTTKKATHVSSSKVEDDDGQIIAQANTNLNKRTLASLENCSKGLSNIKLESPLNLSVVQDENGKITLGTTINGRKLNYAEKMVLEMMLKQTQQRKKPVSRHSN